MPGPEAQLGVFVPSNPPVAGGFGCGNNPNPLIGPVGDSGSKKRHLPPMMQIQRPCNGPSEGSATGFDVSPIVDELLGGSPANPPLNGGIVPEGRPVGDSGSKKRHPGIAAADSASSFEPATPEPGTLLLLGTGILGLLAVRRRLASAHGPNQGR